MENILDELTPIPERIRHTNTEEEMDHKPVYDREYVHLAREGADRIRR